MGGRHATTRHRTPAVSLADEPGAVRQCLQAYADRGVFRGFTERPRRSDRVVFSFTWLARAPYDLIYEPATGSFTFTNVLPNVSARTPLARALKTFIEARSATRLPEHRRINPRRASVTAFVRQGTMRLQIVAKSGHHAYGANRVVNLVHEVYLHLQSYYPEYLWDNYDVPQD